MKTLYLSMALLASAVGLSTLNGCQTDSAGTTNTLGSYTALVDGRPDKVTKAARSAVEDLKLNNIESQATEVDGKVTATTAQGADVHVDVVQKGDNVSQVTVRVGSGDQAVSEDILNRIKKSMD